MLHVIKANGEKEAFHEEKVRSSIRRAGLPHTLEDQILDHVKSKLYDDIPTSEIYHHIIEFLRHTPNEYIVSRYSLKQAIMLLGPTGYPFEDFVAKVLEAQGYTTQVRQILQGECVNHEIDVIARKDNEAIMIEAKFHNAPGTRSDIQVAMYTKARFDDIKEHHTLTDAWLVTNTKTTIDANAYALCKGLKVVSWSYPEGGSLRDLVEKSQLHPITMLTTLPSTHKMKLLENHIIMCRDIYTNNNVLKMLPLSEQEREKVLSEVSFIHKSNQSF